MRLIPAQRISEWEWFKPTLLLIFFVVLALLNFYLVSKSNFDNFHFKLDFSSKSVNVGDSFTVSVYSQGKKSGGLSAAQVSLAYDRDKLSLTEATPGGYFKNGLALGLDEARTSFSIIADPSKAVSGDWTDASKPLVILTFSVLKPALTTKIYTDRFSLVYFYQKGGFYPQTAGDYVKLLK